MWSVGVLLYILLCGAPPFDGQDDQEIIEKIKIGKYSMEGKMWEHISDEGKAIVKKMLSINYTERPYAKEAIEHQWFKNAPTKPIEPEVLQSCFGNMRNFNVSQKLQ